MNLIFWMSVAGKFSRQAIEIDHRSEKQIPCRVPLEPVLNVLLHRTEIYRAPSMKLPVLVRVGNQRGLVPGNVILLQVRIQNLRDKRLLGRSFDEEMEPDHQYGPPPKTFFSHISPRE